MSRMSELDAELRAAGIDPEVVDLEMVESCREWWQKESGMAMTFVEAVRLIYNLHTVPREGTNRTRKMIPDRG